MLSSSEAILSLSQTVPVLMYLYLCFLYRSSAFKLSYLSFIVLIMMSVTLLWASPIYFGLLRIENPDFLRSVVGLAETEVIERMESSL